MADGPAPNAPTNVIARKPKTKSNQVIANASFTYVVPLTPTTRVDRTGASGS